MSETKVSNFKRCAKDRHAYVTAPHGTIKRCTKCGDWKHIIKPGDVVFVNKPTVMPEGKGE